jgi:hypothetical protein
MPTKLSNQKTLEIPWKMMMIAISYNPLRRYLDFIHCKKRGRKSTG